MRARPPSAKASPAHRGVGERLRSVSSVNLTRLAHVGLWALLGVTFLAAAVALLRPPPQATAAVKAPESTVGAQGFAELYVAAYLGAGKGTEATLRAFYPGPVDLADVDPGGAYAGRTTTVDVKEAGPHYWSVTVGVEVLFPKGGGLQSAGVRFYQVGVARSAGAYVATSLPAQVPAPATGRVKLALASPDRPNDNDPVAAAVGRFASAYLAGQGELARYVSPGSTLTAVRPAPFTAVEVAGLSSRDVERKVGEVVVRAKEVLAEIQGTDAGGRTQVLDYALELAQRAGRWEVAKLLPGPALADTQPAPTTSQAPAADAPTSPPTTASVLAVPTSSASATSPTTTSVTPTTTALAATPTTAGRPASPERTTTTR